MRYIFIVLLSIVCSQQIISQPIRVLDKTNLQPIPNAAVYSQDPQASAVTDRYGIIDATPFKDSKVIIFDHLGYHTETYTFAELEKMGFKVLLTEKSYVIDEIVVSASRFEEKRRDVAQVIQVINTKDIGFVNQSSTADLLQSSGNVMVQKSQLGGGSPVIRGFETNKVLMVLDGVRMNNAIYRGGHLQNIITLDNSIFEKVEIIFGPASVVYGSDALGGVMHFYTRNPTLSADTNTLVKVNAFSRFATAAGELSEHGDISIAGQKFGSLTSFTFSDFGDLRQGGRRSPFTPDFGKRDFYVERVNDKDSVFINDDPNIQKQSGYRQIDVLQKFLYRPSDRVSHLFNIQYSTSSDIPRYDRLTQVSGSNPKFVEWYYGPQERLFASYTLSLNSINTIYDHARFIIGYQAIEESRHDRRFSTTTLNHRTERLNIGSFNADFDKLVKRQELRYGFEATYNDVTSTAFAKDIRDESTSELDTRYPDGGSTYASLAAYFTHTYEFNSKWIINDGIRLSQVKLHSEFIDTTFFPFPFNEVSQKNLALNGNLGLIFMPGQGWRFTTVVSSGYRAPNVDDLSKVFESIAGSVIVPNPNLEPEYTYNLDLGISRSIGSQIHFGINGYYTWYRNAITTQVGLFEGKDSIIYDGQLSRVLMNENAGKAYIYGVNAVASADITHAFSLKTTLNYTYGRLLTDSIPYPLDHIPPVYGKTSLIVNLQKFKGEFFIAYSAWKRLEDYNMFGEDNFAYATPLGMPSWFTLNLRTAYQLSPSIQLQIALENILDQNYRVFASNISAPGRNLIITVKGNF